jgi:hypothetical protein
MKKILPLLSAIIFLSACEQKDICVETETKQNPQGAHYLLDRKGNPKKLFSGKSICLSENGNIKSLGNFGNGWPREIIELHSNGSLDTFMSFGVGGQTKTIAVYAENDIGLTSDLLTGIRECSGLKGRSIEFRDGLRSDIQSGKWTTCGSKIMEFNFVDGRPDGYQYLLLLVPQEAIFKKGTLLEGDAFWRLSSKEFFNGALSQYSDVFWSEFSQY